MMGMAQVYVSQDLTTSYQYSPESLSDSLALRSRSMDRLSE